MTDREKVDAKRNEIVQSILGYIEQHPTNWLSGWVSLGVPQNGLTNSNYRGLNALYLWLIGKQQGYTDNRWVTFNQAKELGASVKKGEKSSPILFYTLYDKNTKKEYTRKTTADMTDEERKKYEDENVRPVVRYSQVFNAQQCANFPERAATSLMSDEERQKHSNDVIERIIANSEAPVLYDGGDRAFYRITTDDIHLPAIEQFNTMQDYYATALHEIAHSTGHPSRLNRKMGGADRENYALEELRAEMAAIFMQMENGIQLEGKHYENHSAYLASWLETVKNDTKIFTSAVSDAMKISDYVTEHYVNKASVATLDEQDVVAEPNDDLNVAIKAYYMQTFPTDDAGQDIPDGVTFKDFNEYLTTGDYESVQACFVNDSVVRERLFARLAKITNQKYNDVYNQWLNIYENSQSSAAGTVDDTKENEQSSVVEVERREPVVLNPDSRFAEQVDAVLSGADTTSTHLKVMDTPFLLRQVGTPNLPILMTAKHLKTTTQDSGNESVNYHGLDVDIIKRLPELLSDPVMIMDSLTRDDSIVVVTETVDRENHPVIGAVMFNGVGRENGRIISANILTSTYGKDNFENFINRTVEAGKLLYWNKEKSQSLTVNPGIQFPDVISTFDSDIIIRKSNAFVNTQTQNSSKNSEEVENNVSNVTQQAVEQPQITVADKQPTEQVAATVADVAASKAGRPVVKLRMTEAEANVFAEFVTARNDSGMGEKQVIDMGVDRPQSRDFWIGLSYLGKVKQDGMSFSVEFDRSKEYIPFEFEDVTTKNIDEIAKNQTSNPSSTSTVATEVKTQKKNPSAQTTTSSSSSQKWQRVTIPADCIGQEYGARTMVSIPNTSGYTGFAMFVPTKMLQKQENGTYALLYDSTKKDFLKASNDGREVVFDGETLDKIMRGEKVPYQAKRVRAGKEAQKMIEQTLANIPSEMQEMERWCVHQKYYEKNAEGKTQVKKRIFDVNRIEEQSDNFAKCNDPSTWASIDVATSAIKTSKKALTGLTFVVGEGISVIDLDHCFDSAGHPSALATDLMSAFEGTTYMEKSMSGTGLHIFVKGDLRNAGKFGKVNKGDFGDIEVYDESKFMSVTGNIIGDVRTLGNVTALQQAAVQKYLKANEMAQKKTTTTQKRSAFSTGFVSDDDVIAKIRASKRGAEFDSLYAGHKEGKDWSREDYALINIVAFFTPNQDRNQIQRIFEHSGLYRPQKGEKYIDRTIDAVLSKLKNPTNIWNNQSTSGAAKPKTGDTK